MSTPLVDTRRPETRFADFAASIWCGSYPHIVVRARERGLPLWLAELQCPAIGITGYRLAAHFIAQFIIGTVVQV
jgi:hypothetical protein